MSAQERLAVRRQDSLPIWLSFRQWIDSDELKGALPKNPLGKALEYVKKHEAALGRYLDDERVPFDNNQSEQTIRPLVIGRKNWTFLGHPQAAAGRLKLFSMVSSAHRHHLIVVDYLTDVLYKLAYAQQLEPHL